MTIVVPNIMSMSLVSSASTTNLYKESIVVGGFSVMPLYSILVMLALESSVEYTDSRFKIHDSRRFID